MGEFDGNLRKLKQKEPQRLREIKKTIRKHRTLPVPVPGDTRTALMVLSQEKQLLEDPVTGLGSRRYFERELVRELGRASREKSLLGVVVGDARNLKRVNDTFGHKAGDEFLRGIASGMRQAKLRATDVTARIAGDEFGVLMSDLNGEDAANPNLSEKDRLAAVSLRLVRHIHQQKPSYRGHDITVPHVDFGATVAVSSDTPDSVVERADQASYIAKRLIEPGQEAVVIATVDGGGRKTFEIARFVDSTITYERVENAEDILGRMETHHG